MSTTVSALARPFARIPEIHRRRIGLILLTIAALAFPILHPNDADVDSMANAAAYATLALGLNIVVGFAGLRRQNGDPVQQDIFVARIRFDPVEAQASRPGIAGKRQHQDRAPKLAPGEHPAVGISDAERGPDHIHRTQRSRLCRCARPAEKCEQDEPDQR